MESLNMKQVCGTILAKMFAKALAILILLSGPAWSNSDYSLVLIGGGLEFCSSNDPRQCQKALNVDSDTLVDFLYQLDNTRLDSIRQAPWLTGREKIK